ncbi:MAG TPA: serine/threonine-protein kinase, partial [Gemmataceae bacterium]|nr:serine/threonine-protein kinase [Gemmataceae bacterium]
MAGQRLGDFQLLEALGSGSFATVYLARQISLDRQVALKVATTQDSEARTLATLEHEHIVHVFSETIDTQRGLRLLCMKFVPGTDLERVMRALGKRDPSEWSGQAILDAIDAQCRHEAMFDLAALRDRDRLADMSFAEAVCWLGARLAEALAHAHSRGVLHRDIKPANILLNRYGRPLLSDFNLAHSSRRDRGRAHFGGTIRYMAPEHLDAFTQGGGTQAVDERSDIYSLGVVLYELLTGRPFMSHTGAGTQTQMLRMLAEHRREKAPSPREVRDTIPVVVDRVIRRCLEPDPGHRYQKAEELVRALDGCRELLQMERDFPRPLAVTRASEKRPGLTITWLALVPHLLGSIVNITYNKLSIVDNLSPSQKTAFGQLILVYNVIVYPLLVWVWCRAIIPILQLRRRLAGPEPVSAEEVRHLRRKSLKLPTLLIVLSCLGWLPGGLLFPLGISLLSEPVSAEVFGHFLVSFTVSGLIATTYSYFGTQFLVLRILYPRLWVDPQAPRQQARRELGSLEGRLRVFQFAAGLIPLSGAILMVSVGEVEQFTLGFRLLVVGLIGLGMAGFGAALLV